MFLFAWQEKTLADLGKKTALPDTDK